MISLSIDALGFICLEVGHALKQTRTHTLYMIFTNIFSHIDLYMLFFMKSDNISFD